MNKKIFRIAIRMTAALFLATILAAAFITAQEAQAQPPAGKKLPVKMGPRDSLGLTAEQEKALETFRKARMDENRAFREEMMKLRAERAKAAFRHRGEVEKIFTPEQLEKMKTFRARVMDRPGMSGRGWMGFGRMGFRGPGMGRFMGPGFGMRRMGRFGAFPHRPFPGWRWRR
jgi:hypothetical protein